VITSLSGMVWNIFPIEAGTEIFSEVQGVDYREEAGIVGQKHHSALPEQGNYLILFYRTAAENERIRR
jgi:hypothetical protein